MRKIFLMLAAVAIGFASCKSVDEESPVISVTDDVVYTLNYQAQTLTVKVKSNTGYSVNIPTSAQAWISEIPQTRALSPGEIKFDVKKSIQTFERQAVITLNANGDEQTFKVVQNPPPGEFSLNVVDTNLKQDEIQGILTVQEISKEGAVIPVYVKTTAPEFNVHVDVTTPWISIISGPGVNPVLIRVAEARSFPKADMYDYSEQRRATVHFEAVDADNITLSADLVIEQKPRVAGDYVLAFDAVATELEGTPTEDQLIDNSLLGKLLLAEYDAFRVSMRKLVVKTAPNTGNKKVNLTGYDIAAVRKHIKYLDTLDLGGATFNAVLENDVVITPAEIPLNWYDGDNTIAKIVLPEGLTKINDKAFQLCSALKEVVFPSTLKEIGSYAFSKSGLSEVRLPENLEILGTFAFSECANLKALTMSKKITTIGNSAFNLVKLEGSVTFPRTLTSIGEKAFYGHRFSGIKFDEPNQEYVVGSDTERMTVGPQAFNAFAFTPSIASIKTGGAKAAGDLVIPNWAGSLGMWAFAGVAADTTKNAPLIKLTIGKNISLAANSYGHFALNPQINRIDYVDGGAALTFPVVSSNDANRGIFSYCSVTEATYPMNGRFPAEEIPGSGMFHCWEKLRKVTIKSGVKKIGYAAFAGYAYPSASIDIGLSLDEFVIENPEELTEIASYAFYKLAKIPNDEMDLSATRVTTLGDYAFADATGIKTIKLPATLTNIAVAFRKYNVAGGYAELDFRNTNVTNIPANAFNGNTNLKRVYLKAGTTVAAVTAFTGITTEATGLVVYIPEGETRHTNIPNTITVDYY